MIGMFQALDIALTIAGAAALAASFWMEDRCQKEIAADRARQTGYGQQ